MNETTTMNKPVETESKKPYAFRKLCADDMFLMFNIIKAIGLKEFKDCLEGDAVAKMIDAVKNSGDEKNKEDALLAVGAGVALAIVDLVIGNLPKCKNDIYQLLSQVSGLSEEEVKGDMIMFTEMVIDFVHKEEFPAFFKVVSRLFK